MNAKDLSGLCGFHSDLNQLVLVGVDVDGAVAHGQTNIAAHELMYQNKARAYDLVAGLGFDQLQSGANGVSGGVGCAAQQAVSLAHLYQHGAEVVALQQRLLALLSSHLALAQLYHGVHHFVHALVGFGVQDLGAVDTAAIGVSSLFYGLHIADQHNIHDVAAQQTAGSLQNAAISAFGENDGAGLFLQLGNQAVKHAHNYFPPIISLIDPAADAAHRPNGDRHTFGPPILPYFSTPAQNFKTVSAISAIMISNDFGRVFVMDISELQTDCLQCRRCPLCAERRHVVFGQGVPNAEVLFIGEGPGAQEDEQGLPFVGRSGQLLDRYLYAIDLDRSKNIYIANIVKCRPPQNRDPLPEESSACMPWLEEQIRLIDPKIIVCLGRVAAKQMMDPDISIMRQHGEFIQKDGRWYMATLHPAALLRNPAAKPDAFGDFVALRQKIREVCRHTY